MRRCDKRKHITWRHILTLSARKEYSYYDATDVEDDDVR